MRSRQDYYDYHPTMDPDPVELWLIDCTRAQFIALVKKLRIKHQFVV